MIAVPGRKIRIVDLVTGKPVPNRFVVRNQKLRYRKRTTKRVGKTETPTEVGVSYT